MSQISTNEFKAGIKVEIDGQPWNIISNEYVKPGKGQAFNRVKFKNLVTGRVVEKTMKSGEKLDLADVQETKMRMIYKEQQGVVFMDDTTYEQTTIPNAQVGDSTQWLKEDILYDIVFFKGQAISVVPPTFMELKIVETAPGARGDTASGRVLKQAITETGAKVQIPIFIDEGETVKIDTRNGGYVSRAQQ